MTTALVPMQDLDRMALAFSKSALFGSKTPEQCMALLLLAQAEGQHPAIAMRDFDVIQNRPAKKAEAMLRSFLSAGGIVEWHEMSDTKADASFTHPQGSAGKPVRISWDMERAKKAGLTGKDMYAKYARQMLANRVISEGCRRVYPAATSGMYEPGEVRMIARQEKDMGSVEPLPAESTTASTAPPAAAADPASVAGGGATETRTETLKRMCAEAQVTVPDMCAKAGVHTAEEFTEDDWASAMRFLKKKAGSLKAAQ